MRWPLAVALLPALLGFGFHHAGARPQFSEPGPARPPLAFHQYVVNLGPVPSEPNHFARFAFTNRSDHRVRIRRLESSCGCLTQQLEKREFAPGERGQFRLRIQSANQTPGPKDYTCKVFYGPTNDDSVEYMEEVVFRLVLPELSVTLNPRALVIQQPTADPIRHPFEVRDLRNKRLHVLGAACEPPLAEVRLLPREELTLDELRSGIIQRIEISVGAVPPGTHECVVVVQTNDADFPTLQMPLRIHGASSSSD